MSIRLIASVVDVAEFYFSQKSKRVEMRNVDGENRQLAKRMLEAFRGKVLTTRPISETEEDVRGVIRPMIIGVNIDSVESFETFAPQVIVNVKGDVDIRYYTEEVEGKW